MPWVTVFFNHNIRGQDFYVGETDHYGWDTHNDIFEDMSEHLMPRFDYSFSALLEDLHERGLMKDTLVVCMGEFGRHHALQMKRTSRAAARRGGDIGHRAIQWCWRERGSRPAALMDDPTNTPPTRSPIQSRRPT